MQPKPLLALLVRGPYQATTVIVYEDGLVLYRLRRERQPYCYAYQFEAQALTRFLADLPIGDLAGLETHYKLTHGTDQAESMIFFWREGQPAAVRTYGPLKELESWPKESNVDSLDQLKPFITIFEQLLALQAHEDTLWVPEKITVIMHEFYETKLEGIAWDPALPDLNHSETRAIPTYTASEAYELQVDSQHLDLIRKVDPGWGPVVMNGRKWSFGFTLRLPMEEALESFMYGGRFTLTD